MSEPRPSGSGPRPRSLTLAALTDGPARYGCSSTARVSGPACVRYVVAMIRYTPPLGQRKVIRALMPPPDAR
jgi:hypothetical protein